MFISASILRIVDFIFLCEGNSLFSDDISDILLVILWTSLWAAPIPRSLPFPQLLILQGIFSFTTIHMPPRLYRGRSCALWSLFKKKAHAFDHVMRSTCSSHILLWCYVYDLICPRREKQVVNQLLLLRSKRL